MSAFDKIVTARMVPVVRTNSSENANRLIESLVRNGAKIIEVTLTIPDALTVISRWSKDVFVGAGTVLTAAQASEAVSAGAQFLVAPGFDQGVLEFSKKAGKLYVPGVLSPTEVMNVQAHGLNVVKLFPAGVVGGEKYVRALAKVFPKMSWLVTGGVSLETMDGLLDAGAVLGVGESMMSDELIARGDWAKVDTQIAQYYARLNAKLRR